MRRLARRFALLALLATPAGAAASHWNARFYYLEDRDGAASLQAHYSDMGALSPVWFTVEVDGALTATVSPKLVAFAAAHKLPLIPVIANRDFKPQAVEAACSDGVREKLIAMLLKYAADDHLSGFELDMEEIPPALRGGYSRFVAALAEALHRQHLQLGIAIPAPLTPGSAPQAKPPVWVLNPRAAAFDYRQLAGAADSLTLMAYDEYTAPEQPGPVAGFLWVEACVRTMLQSVPPEKLLLGLALYYRQWSGNKVSEGPFPLARFMASKWSTGLALDASHREMTCAFSVGPVNHVVWGEDASSLAARLALVDRHRLLGFAAWRLGQEDPAVWGKVFRQFNGKRTQGK